MKLLRTVLLVCLSVAAFSVAATHHHHHHRGHADRAGAFDYYLMSLSWSPSYCTTHPRDRTQCGNHGFGFVLHGLWPQNRNGSWPQHCATSSSPDAATIARALAFMPSRRLIDHEWQTHGACSGLSPAAYFAQADKAFASIRIPSVLSAPKSPPALSANDVAQAFIAVNPGLHRNMLSVVCHDGNALAEVRVCLNRGELTPRACGGRMRNTCRYGTLKIAAVR